jgi:hypothetical protein
MPMAIAAGFNAVRSTKKWQQFLRVDEQARHSYSPFDHAEKRFGQILQRPMTSPGVAM